MNDLHDIAREQARNFGLDEVLVLAVCEQESGWNPWVSRYEPEFFNRYLDNSTVHLVVQAHCRKVPYPVSFETELRERAFSRGLMQVMGQVARERGFADPLPQLHDPAANLMVGCRHLKKCLDGAGGDIRRALLRWNGGGDPQYPDKVLARMVHYANPDTSDPGVGGGDR